MAGAIAELAVNIIGNTKSLDTSIDNSKKSVDKFDKTLTTMSGTVKKLLGAGALIALAAKVKDIGVASINAASDAQETQNKFDVVFSSISTYANDMAVSLATSYGTSIQGAKDMLAGTGDLLTGLGFTQQSAFDLSEQVLTLGADLASFTNYSGGASGASEALTKALLGEREMLKGLGISINEADVKAELLRQKQQGLTFETEKQAKAQATLTLAFSQTANAQGDFARSSESYANQVKIAQARTADLQVELGRALLPTATKGIGIFSELTGKLASYIKSLNDVKIAEEAQASGNATQEQKLILLQQELDKNNDLLNGLKNTAKFQVESGQAIDVLTKKQIKDLEIKNARINTQVTGIKTQIKTTSDLAEAERLKGQQEEENARLAEENEANRKKQQEQNLDGIAKIIEAHKTDQQVIDDEIAQLQSYTDLDAEAKAQQLAAIEQLQADKQAILDEERAEREAEYQERTQKEIDLNNTVYELAQKKAADEEAFRLKRIDDLNAEGELILSFAEGIAQIYSNLQDSRIAGIDATALAKINALDQETLGDTEYAKQKLAIEKEAAYDVWKIQKEQFKTSQGLAYAQIALETAIAVAKVWGQTGIYGVLAQIAPIAMGVVQAGIVASQPAPARPQLATGAIIAGSQRGVDVTVGESGNDELILGGGSKGDAILSRFADKINSKMGGGQSTIVINQSNMLNLSDDANISRVAELLYEPLNKVSQRRGN